MKYASVLAGVIMAAGLSACGSSAPSVEGKWCSPDGSIMFKPEGKVEMESEGQTATGTYTFDGKTVVAKRDGPEDITAAITLGEDGKLRMENVDMAPLERCK